MVKVIHISQDFGYTLEMHRINYLKNAGFQVEIGGFIRSKIGKQDSQLSYLPKKYFSRIPAYFLFALKILKRKQDKYAIYYIHGIDNLIILYLVHLISFRDFKFISEIKDVREIKIMGYNVLKNFERRILLKSLAVVVTSEYFITEYYNIQTKRKIQNFILLLNKVHYPNVINIKNKSNGEKVVIGYFGYIRCIKSVKFLYHLATQLPRFIIILRGRPNSVVKEFLDGVTELNNFRFFGEYDGINELDKIYSEIDLVWAVYPVSDQKSINWRLAQTIRYHEGGYYCVPLIAHSGTKDGEKVLANNIGEVVDLNDIGNTIKIFERLDRSRIARFRENIRRMDPSNFVIKDDYIHMIEIIKKNNESV